MVEHYSYSVNTAVRFCLKSIKIIVNEKLITIKGSCSLMIKHHTWNFVEMTVKFRPEWAFVVQWQNVRLPISRLGFDSRQSH